MTFIVPFIGKSLFQVFPINTTTCVGDFANFTCSTTISEGRLFWFVDDKPVNALPPDYQALSVSDRRQDSTFLRLLGREETNNSEVVCAIDPSREISIFSDPVFLIGMLQTFLLASWLIAIN